MEVSATGPSITVASMCLPGAKPGVPESPRNWNCSNYIHLYIVNQGNRGLYLLAQFGTMLQVVQIGGLDMMLSRGKSWWSVRRAERHDRLLATPRTMKITLIPLLVLLVATLAWPLPALLAQTTWTADQLAERTVHRRAVEAIIWGIPLVNYDLMFQSFVRDAKGGVNQILYWSGLSDWKNQYLTPNPDTIYFMPFFSTKDAEPMVLEIPPADDGSITGTIMDCWQMALEDVGPAGVDKGKGGKYLILPPGYKDKAPEGYITLPSATYQGFALLRSILKSRDAADIAKAVEYGKRIKLYPLSAAANPPATTFIDAINVVVTGVIPYDVRFFQSLTACASEPWIERDRAMIDPLKSLGIEKGKPFQPEDKTADILKSAAQEAMARFDVLYETIYEPFNKGTRWFLPADEDLTDSIESGFAKSDIYSTDGRGILFYFAYSTIKHLGAGQFYLFVSRDKDGDPLNGAETYCLHVPPKPPVRQYWSAVLYDFATHALIRDMPYASRSSQSPGLQTNTDGSVDIYFAPKAPDGEESNWIPTDAKGRFEALFRFYGPDKPLFDHTWVLPDIEKVK